MIRKLYTKSFKRLSRGQCYLMVFCTFIAIAVVLFSLEYRKFRKLSSELLDLKEDYRVYTIALKKTLDEQAPTNGQANADQKKKLTKQIAIDESNGESTFFTVNRDDEYLLANALELARMHNLENPVAQLFDELEWEKRVRPHLQKKKKKGKRFVGIPARIRKAAQAKSGPRDFAFSWPIERSKFWLSSLFGPRKMKNSKARFHYGVDMAAHKGTPVKAAATGIILESYWNNGYGNCIIIAHNRKYKTRYAHLDSRRVKIGQKVKRGEVIGTVGDTGLVRKSGKDASHLHFEVYAFGRHINPLRVLV